MTASVKKHMQAHHNPSSLFLLTFPSPKLIYKTFLLVSQLKITLKNSQIMEAITMSSILISIVCIILVSGIAKAVNWVWLKPKKLEKRLRQQGIPGTSYRLLIGDMKDFTSMRTKALENPMTSFSHDYGSRVEPFRHHLMTKFGKDYFLWAGPMPMVNVSKPELIREALTKIHEFPKAKFNPVFDKLFPGIVSYEGEKWTKHRKIINPAFHMEKLKLMLPALYDSCTDMITKWEKIGAETGSSEVDMWPHLTTLTSDVISRAAFGSSYKEGQRIFELLTEQIDLALSMLLSVNIPGWRFVPTPTNRRFEELQKLINTLLKEIINKRREAINAGEAPKGDLLGILMDSNLREIQQATSNDKKDKLGMSLQEVIDECKLFYVAGQETTSVLLVWTLILLSKHQDWQARAREEVLQTFGKNVPDFEGLNRLKIVTMILHEVLRLYPPATQIDRAISKETKLGELSLPAGTLVNFQVLFVHQDKEIWGDDAEEFRPERFSEGISKATRGNISFFPFGWGPRICMGEKFAMTEAKLALSMILQRFSFELSPNYTHAPMTIFFVQPQHGAQIMLRQL